MVVFVGFCCLTSGLCAVISAGFTLKVIMSVFRACVGLYYAVVWGYNFALLADYF